MITHQSSGMIAPSATNPFDEVPIGPQVFPFGTPSEIQSQVNPYTATNYQAGQTSTNVIQSTAQIYPATAYQTSPTQVIDAGAYQTGGVQQVIDSGAYQTTEVLPTSTYQNAPVQQEVIDTSAYQGAQYQTVGEALSTVVSQQTIPTTSYTTGYQTVVKYKPVTKTVMVPKVTTKYVPVNSSVAGSLAASMSPTTQMPPVPIGRGDHFISNYPIYENDPRRVASTVV